MNKSQNQEMRRTGINYFSYQLNKKCFHFAPLMLRGEWPSGLGSFHQVTDVMLGRVS